MSTAHGKGTVLIEIGHSSIKIARGRVRRELMLERRPDGAMTDVCRQRVRECLQEIAPARFGRRRALCAIGARGVSLRRISLPPRAGDNLDQLVGLQIESEFPLPPEELAWGYCRANPGAATTDLVVVALRRESLEQYAELFTAAGLEPAFTLSALAGSSLCAPESGGFGVLDVGRSHSELILFEEGVPTAVRSFGWGGEDLTQTLAGKLGLSRKEAEQIKLQLGQETPPETAQTVREAIQSGARELASLLGGQVGRRKLYVTGGGARAEGFAETLGELLGTESPRVDIDSDLGSAALAGLNEQKNGSGLPLRIRTGRPAPAEPRARAGWKWAALACALGLVLLSSRYWESATKKAELARRLAETKAGWSEQTEVDRELGFFRYLETNQPPYLEELEAIAKSAARGTKITSLSLNRRGDLSLRGTMPSATQAAEFRTKLIESGWFANVVLEEQTPGQNDPKVTVRISARGNAGPGPEGRPANPEPD